MVDPLVREEPDFVQRFGDELLLAPVDIPIVVFGLFVGAVEQARLDAVGEIGLELDFGAAVMRRVRVEGEQVLFYVFSKVLRHPCN